MGELPWGEAALDSAKSKPDSLQCTRMSRADDLPLQFVRDPYPY